MRAARLALLPLGIGFGVAAEWLSDDTGDLAAADLAVGCVLIACGVLAWERRPESRVGPLMSLAALTWFLGTLLDAALFLHRGPLIHLLLSYPTGRLSTRPARVVVAAAYVDAAIEPLARNDVLTVALSAAVALTAAHKFLGTSGPARKAGGPALVAALAFAGVLGAGAVARLADPNANTDAILGVYDAVVAGIAILLLFDLLRGRWSEAVVTGLVVDLGKPAEAGTLRAKLARALGDPSLVIGYRIPETGALVDDAGRSVVLPPAGSGTAATPIDDRGETIAFLIHDEALLADRRLVESVAAAARFSLANARLQAEAHARAAELDASRRRIVEAEDAQRRRLERELRLGAELRLERVGTLLGDARAAAAGEQDSIAALERDFDAARSELREFAQGVHPAALTEEGLTSALSSLAGRSPLPVEITSTSEALPAPLEAAVFFVCSEALANVAKHATATRASIDVRADRERVTVAIADDGTGGADPRRGSGLRGLADRVEALGGRLSVESPPGAGTRVIAELPIRG